MGGKGRSLHFARENRLKVHRICEENRNGERGHGPGGWRKNKCCNQEDGGKDPLLFRRGTLKKVAQRGWTTRGGDDAP